MTKQKHHIHIAYMGSSSSSAWMLEQLLYDTELPIAIDCVITQPDRPVGRRQVITPNPVKHCAEQWSIATCDGTFAKMRDMEVFKNIDLCIVFAYGKIIPPWILEKPPLGCWNVHPSLLPQYRGPSPIAYPLLMGETTTGTTLMAMDKELDHGNIIKQVEVAIDPYEKRDVLERKLTHESFYILHTCLKEIAKKNQKGISINQVQQKHADATYTRILTKEDGYIPFSLLDNILANPHKNTPHLPPIAHDYLTRNIYKNTPPLSDGNRLYNWFRGMVPWPGMWTFIPTHPTQKRLKIIDMIWNQEKPQITTVQLEGKNPVDMATFRRAYNVFTY